MKNTLRFYFLVLFILVTTTLSAKTIYYVTQNGTGDGSSWAKAAGNIQTMIDKAASGDEVWVAKGTYYPTTEVIARDPRSRTFLLKSGVNLYGGFAGNETNIRMRSLTDLDINGRIDSCELTNTSILSGDIDGVVDVWIKTNIVAENSWKWDVTGNEKNCYHVVTGSSNDRIDGFSIVGGNANTTSENKGGGILSSSYVANCTISNCSSQYGGGIYFSSSSSLSANYYIVNCKVSKCSSSGNGGGILAYPSYKASNSNFFISNCSISECAALFSGGGIMSSASSSSISSPSHSNVRVSNCLISNCSSRSHGGGIFSDATSANNMVNSSNSSNSSVINCVILDCSSGQSGGGIFSSASANSNSSVLNCKVSNCSSQFGGGGIHSLSTSADILGRIFSSISSVGNCVISNCKTTSFGGGIFSEPNSPLGDNNEQPAPSYSYITNCTITNCYSGVEGGGIYSYTALSSNSSTAVSYPYVINCVVSNCSAPKSGGIYAKDMRNCASSNNITNVSVGNGLSGIQSGCFSPDIKITYVKPTSFIGIATTDAQKAELTNANWHLKEGSPCINTGTSFYINGSDISSTILMGKDFDNNLRILNKNIDVGAYEYVMPIIQMPLSEKFDYTSVWDNSPLFYNSAQINGGQDITWTLTNQKAVFSWQTSLNSGYKSAQFFTYQIDALKTSKVILRYDMLFEAYSGSISQLGTEKLLVQYSFDLEDWKSITNYSNQNGTIPNKTYMHDISSLVAGKTFFIRFIAIGEDSKRIEKWEIDNIIVDTNGMTTDVKQIKDATFSCTIKDGQLNIQNLVEDTSIQLFDMTGKLLNNRKVKNNSISFTLPVHGIYIVRTESESGIESKKVVW